MKQAIKVNEAIELCHRQIISELSARRRTWAVPARRKLTDDRAIEICDDISGKFMAAQIARSSIPDQTQGCSVCFDSPVARSSLGSSGRARSRSSAYQ